MSKPLWFYLLLLTLQWICLPVHASENGELKPRLYAQDFPRPLQLVDSLPKGLLRQKLQNCRNLAVKKSDFSIAHRGAPLKFPEHTRESYIAAAQMGAGVIECDVTFTKDKKLVCRHDQCDLHSTTNILLTPLANKCTQKFKAAKFDLRGKLIEKASARCCSSDISLIEFKTLEGKLDAINPAATTVQEFVSPRHGAYKGPATLMTHKESIALFKTLNVKMIPELKRPGVKMPYEGMTQAAFAQKLVNEYKQAGVDPDRVLLQSFYYDDILYWLKQEPKFKTVFLDGRFTLAGFKHSDPNTWKPGMEQMASHGVKILSPPLWMLMDLDKNRIVPSLYAKQAKQAGLELIPWSLERSGQLSRSRGAWFYQTVSSAIGSNGDVYRVLDMLSKDVGIMAVFSDWPATVTYYANCMSMN